VEGVNSSIIYLIHCKNFCKYSNVPPPSTTVIKKELNVKKVCTVTQTFQLRTVTTSWHLNVKVYVKSKKGSIGNTKTKL
jgi:hypothetical protein